MATKSHEFEVVLQPEAEGGFSVSVPALPGCHTQGETREEALAMARDAIEGYLEVLADEGRPLPQPALIERITVAACARGCRPSASPTDPGPRTEGLEARPFEGKSSPLHALRQPQCGHRSRPRQGYQARHPQRHPRRRSRRKIQDRRALFRPKARYSAPQLRSRDGAARTEPGIAGLEDLAPGGKQGPI